jgi:ribulose-phosphate 3-epimerase
MVTEKAFFNIIDQFTVFKPEFITVHREVISDLKYVKGMLTKKDIKMGVALNPEIGIDSITDAIDYIDLALLMSVKAGFGGQKFIDSTFKKIEDLSSLKRNFLIEVDGGIDLPISLKLKNCGVDLIVVGTNLVNSKDPEGFIKAFKNH